MRLSDLENIFKKYVSFQLKFYAVLVVGYLHCLLTSYCLIAT